MKIDKRSLIQKIQKLKQAVPRRTTMAVLQGLLVKDGYMTANNMQFAIRTKINSEETFIIPSKAFELIINLPDGDVEITGDSEGMTIKAGKITNHYQTLDPFVFPEFTTLPNKNGRFTINADQLLKSMKRVSYAIPATGTPLAITCLDLKARDGKLNFVGLNNHLLAWDKFDFDGEFELLIPKETVEKILTVGLSGKVTISYNEHGALFATDDYEFYTRIVGDKYFDYEKMIRDLELTTKVERDELLGAMIRAKMCTDEKKPAKLSFEGKELGISIKSNATDYNESITIRNRLEKDIAIGFDANYLADTLKAFDCESVILNLEGPRSPMILNSANSEFKALVLPVALAS